MGVGYQDKREEEESWNNRGKKKGSSYVNGLTKLFVKITGEVTRLFSSKQRLNSFEER